MRKMKKLVGLMLAAMMIFSMSATVFAATVTVDTKLEGHTFDAYQIFTGTETENDKQLVDVDWGTGINKDAFLAALKAETSFGDLFKDCEDAADVAEALDHLDGTSVEAKKLAELAYTHKSNTKTSITGTETLASGYYLIVDTTNLEGQDAANNAALLQVTDSINITYKTDKPSVEKKVLEDDKYETDGGYGQGYNDVADYCINEVVTFHLIGRVPDMSEYETYKYWFVDEMDPVLTLDTNSIKVYLSTDKKVDDADTVIDKSYYTDDTTEAGFDVYFKDLKTVPGIAKDFYVIVEYKALLSDDAEPGLNGYINEVYLKYSNNPDQSGAGQPGDDGQPDDDEEQGGLGQTEKDFVIVFTYELDVTKVDGKDDTKKLDGAEFVLYRGEGENKEYVQIDANHKVTGWTTDEEQASTLVTDANGIFKVIGLDDGTYYLKETKAPANYNLLTEDIKLEIKATTSNGQNWVEKDPADALTALELDVTVNGETTEAEGDTDTGIVATNVENNVGATLPETGGIGTMLFYIVGSVLVLGAAVILITRKRMN